MLDVQFHIVLENTVYETCLWYCRMIYKLFIAKLKRKLLIKIILYLGFTS